MKFVIALVLASVASVASATDCVEVVSSNGHSRVITRKVAVVAPVQHYSYDDVEVVEFEVVQRKTVGVPVQKQRRIVQQEVVVKDFVVAEKSRGNAHASQSRGFFNRGREVNRSRSFSFESSRSRH